MLSEVIVRTLTITETVMKYFELSIFSLYNERKTAITCFKVKGDHSKAIDKFCSNFQNLLIRS